MSSGWYWPGGSEVNDIPDPLGIEDQWFPWSGTMEDGPGVFAEIFSREYIQNSWDSIQAKAQVLKGADAGRKASISFYFIELTGDEAGQFAENFGLEDHAKRLKVMEEEQLADNRLGDTFLLKKDFGPIRILVAAESLAEGMPGKWDSGDLKEIPPSRMKIALVQSVTGKGRQGGTGGSWGEGKKAIAAASKARILATYTCHEKTPKDDPGVTRRFMGVTYWRPHDSETKNHRGMGLLGALSQESPNYKSFEPLTNGVADAFVEELGVPHLTVRDPSKIEDHGTSYMFVDPSFTPEELASAIARNWWPLLETHRVDVEVHGFSGESIPITTRGDQKLFPFIKAFDIVRGVDQQNEPTELRAPVKVSSSLAGTVAIVSDVSDSGWSYDQTENGNVDLVALVRNDMVIAYQRFPRVQKRKPPFVRGTFVVSTEGGASKILKMTEGHLHNSWKEDAQQVGDADRAGYAHSVLEQISRKVSELRARISTSDESSDIRIRAFEKIFSGKGPSKGPSGEGKKPPRGPRDFSIQQVSQTVKDYDTADPTKLRFLSVAHISIRPDHSQSHLKVRIDLGWSVFEESSARRDDSLGDPSSIVLPKGFSKLEGEDGVVTGLLTKDPVPFEWSSAYFPDDWQVVPDPQVRGADEGSEG